MRFTRHSPEAGMPIKSHKVSEGATSDLLAHEEGRGPSDICRLAFVVSRFFFQTAKKNCLTDVADKWTSMKELNTKAARQERVEWPWERQQLGAAVRA